VNALLVTLLVSLCLSGVFVLCFLCEHLRRRESGPEHDSLLPLDDPPPPTQDPLHPSL
jgi:hypothetical protein